MHIISYAQRIYTKVYANGYCRSYDAMTLAAPVTSTPPASESTSPEDVKRLEEAIKLERIKAENEKNRAYRAMMAEERVKVIKEWIKVRAEVILSEIDSKDPSSVVDNERFVVNAVNACVQSCKSFLEQEGNNDDDYRPSAMHGSW